MVEPSGVYAMKPVPGAIAGENKSAVNSILALASVGMAAVITMESVLPTAASDVEKAGRNLTSKFMLLSENIMAQMSLIQRLLALFAVHGLDPDQWDMLNNEATRIAKTVNTTISGMVYDMQFQDRNTQMMENATGIIRHYGKMLEEVRNNIESQRNFDVQLAGTHITEAVDAIMSSIRVDEVRNQFRQSLAKAKVLYKGGEDIASGSTADTSVIDLF